MIALVSAKGSPGVTTAALALTLSAPGRCLLAECDPSGGDILAGYLQGSLPADRGLAPLAVAQLRGRLADQFDSHLVDLDAPRRLRLLLPGVADPAQSATVATVWEPLVARLRDWQRDGGDGADSRGADGSPDDGAGGQIVVDCGRLSASHFGWAVLREADRVLLVVRATLPSVAAAVSAVRTLREGLPGGGASQHPALGLLVVGIGPYPGSEVARRLGVPLVGTLPEDRRAASRLSFGGTVHARMPLLRAASRLHTRPARSVPTPVPPPGQAGDAARGGGAREVAGV